MFTVVWAQVAEGAGNAPEPELISLAASLCILLPLGAFLVVMLILYIRMSRRNDAFMRESRRIAERSVACEERMVELLESIEQEMRQLSAWQEGAGKERRFLPTDTAIRPPGQP